jgi:hypothetical protein
MLQGGEPIVAAHVIAERIRKDDVAAWSKDLRPTSWAEESSAQARAVYGELGVTPNYRGIVALPRGYADRERGRVEAALQRAGVRLAALLDRIAMERDGRISSR